MTTNRLDFDRLRTRISGRLALPDDQDFSSVRKWFIGRFAEVVPKAVVHPRDADDVATALLFASDHGLSFALRSGAHSFAEYCTADGLVIDLGGMDTIELSPDRSTVTVGPGVRIGPLAGEIAPAGRVVPFGWCPLVAVAGSAMGGGFGPLGRYFGLACDHLDAAELVAADGRVLRVNEDTEPELLWALRGGGGGNFGAVTSLTFRTRESVPAVNFAAWWPIEAAVDLIDAWQRWSAEAPAAINAELVLRCWPDVTDPPILVVFGLMVNTTPEQAAEHVAELSDLTGVPPSRAEYVELSADEVPTHHTFAGEPAEHVKFGGRPVDAEPGIRFVKSEFFEQTIPRPAIAELVEWLLDDRVSDQQRELEFIPWGGAIGRPGPTDTAFVHRQPRFLLEHTVQAYGPMDLKRASHDWASRSKAIVHPYANGHVYQNYPDPDLTDWADAYYGDNLARLRRIKASYDPDNLFDFEQSIGRLDG